MKSVKIYFAALLFITLLYSCKKDGQSSDDQQTTKLEVKGLSASSARVNDVINIYGAGFSETPAENIVTVISPFDSSNAIVESATTTRLRIRIPWDTKFGDNTIRVQVKGVTVNYSIYITLGFYAAIRHDFSNPAKSVNILAFNERMVFLNDGRYYALPIDNDSCENVVYYPPTSDIVGVTVKNQLVRWNIITKQASVIKLAYPDNVYLEGVVVANDTLYAFKKGNSVKQLVSIDVKTGKEMSAVNFDTPGDSYYSMVYYPATDEIMGLSADYKRLVKYNRSTHAISTVVLSTESYVDYLGLAVAGKTIYVHKRIGPNPPNRTILEEYLGTINPATGNFSFKSDISSVAEGRYKTFFYQTQINALIGTSNKKMVYTFDLATNLLYGIYFGPESLVSYSGVVSNDLPIY